MSIFKREEEVKSADYKKVQSLLWELKDIDFLSTIRELYLTKETLNFYIEGSPDWKAEKEYYERCQLTLLNKIGCYDGIRRDIIEILDKTKAEDCREFSRPRTSHETIRIMTKIVMKEY